MHSGQHTMCRHDSGEDTRCPSTHAGRGRICQAAAATGSNLTAKEQEELAADIKKLEDRESWCGCWAMQIKDGAQCAGPQVIADVKVPCHRLVNVALVQVHRTLHRG
jgi:hypothetical protein